MSLNALAIIFAVLGAASELYGLGTVVKEIKSDRGRARSLLDKKGVWKPKRQPPPRRVSAGAINVRPTGIGSMQVGGSDRHLASMFASVVNGHNQLTHDVGKALDEQKTALLSEIEAGDKELRSVLRELLGNGIRQRAIGVVAIGVGIFLSMTASILSSLG